MNYYIPSKIVVGKHKTYSELGIVVCKYKNSIWTNDNEFKKFTGFSRGTPRDCTKAIEKDLRGVSSEFENDPTNGFKLIPYRRNMYSQQYWTNSYIVEDPRGFQIGITYENLQYILQNTTIVNGVISQQLAYGFRIPDDDYKIKHTHPELRIVGNDSYDTDFTESRNIDNSVENKKAIIKKDELVIGNTYITETPTESREKLLLYIGEINTFRPRDFCKKSIEPYTNGELLKSFCRNDNSQSSLSILLNNRYGSIDSSKMSWNNEEYIKFCNTIKPSKQHIFINLDEYEKANKRMNIGLAFAKCQTLSFIKPKYRSYRSPAHIYRSVIQRGINFKNIVEVVDNHGKYDAIVSICTTHMKNIETAGKLLIDEIKLNFPLERPSQEQYEIWRNEPYVESISLEEFQ